MANGSPPRRIADLHKSAFWIYGVTAMVMREPFAAVIRHIATAGAADWQVRLEMLRTASVLSLMARLFLASGLYFDEVYMRADSAARFPRRSYAIDFLAGLMQFLTIVAASTAVTLHGQLRAGLSFFLLLIILFLLCEVMWLGGASLLRFSSKRQIAALAIPSAGILTCTLVLWGGARIGGTDPVLADQVAFGLLILITLFDIAKLVRRYDRSAIEVPMNAPARKTG